jgi:hypothetical protein
MEITEKQNLDNMRKCPRFDSCSIPLCPLDSDMSERVELPEDDQCPLRKLLIRGKRKKRIKGVLSPTMRGLLSFVRDIQKKSEKPPYKKEV